MLTLRARLMVFINKYGLLPKLSDFHGTDNYLMSLLVRNATGGGSSSMLHT